MSVRLPLTLDWKRDSIIRVEKSTSRLLLTSADLKLGRTKGSGHMKPSASEGECRGGTAGRSDNAWADRQRSRKPGERKSLTRLKGLILLGGGGVGGREAASYKSYKRRDTNAEKWSREWILCKRGITKASYILCGGSVAKELAQSVASMIDYVCRESRFYGKRN